MARHKDQDNDIATKPYQGPSVAASSVGESVIQGKFLLLSGALVGALAGAFFPEHTGKVLDSCRNGLDKLRNSKNYLLLGIGGFAKWSLGIGESLVKEIKEFKPVHTQLTKYEQTDTRKRIATAIDGAILSSTMASFLGFFNGGTSGARHAQRSRKQVKELQTEILTLRDDGDDLRKKLIDTQRELEAAKTTQSHTEKLGYTPTAEHHPNRRASDHQPRESWAHDVRHQQAETETVRAL